MLLFVVGCSDGSNSLSDQRLAEASERWENADVQNYTIAYFVTSGLGRIGPTAMEVQGGEVVKADPDDPTQRLFSVNDLFEEIESADVVLNAEFDPDLGYPTRIALDPIEKHIDDEFGVQVVMVEVPGGPSETTSTRSEET